MEKYYFLTEDSSKTGVPIFFEYSLCDKFIEKESYIKEWQLPHVDITMGWDYNRSAITPENISKIQLPEKIVLINKHKNINFDMYHGNSSFAFIVSKEFKNVIDEIDHPKYVFCPMEVLNRDGEQNTKKEYFYILFLESSPCINFSKSDVKILPLTVDAEQPRVNKYLNKVTFDSSKFIPKDLFWIDNSYINNYLFCNQKTVEVIEKNKIKTIKIMEMESFFDWLNENMNFGRKTKLIIE